MIKVVILGTRSVTFRLFIAAYSSGLKHLNGTYARTIFRLSSVCI